MKIHSPIGGFHSLTKLCGGLHILRILLLVPLTVLLHLRRAAAAVALGLMLLLDLAASLLARRFDLADEAGIVLESIADLLIQAIDRVISEKTVTFDLAEMIPGSTELTCSAYGDKLVETLS